MLDYHQNYLNSVVRDLNGINLSHLPSWIPENIRQIKDPIQIKLLCGADLLESFATPGLWDIDDVSSENFPLTTKYWYRTKNVHFHIF